ncbi:MAG TPA: hypothetical protein VIH97_00995 [Candidatus Acidoferrales bacterium]
MKRFRTGRPVSQWAGLQTGPMTVDVEALWANRDQNYRYVPPPITPPATQPTPPPEASPINETTQAAACTGAAVETKCIAEVPEESVTKKTGNLLDELPAFKAAIESFEKRGDPIRIPAGTEPTVAKSQPKRRRAKPKPPKQKRNLLAARKSSRPSVPRKQSQPKTQAEIDVMRHRRLCTICHHPERAAIEEAFLQWRNVRLIAGEFHASGGPTAIYRHARALNLFKKRNLNLRSALELMIEHSERSSPSAEAIIKAIRAHTRMNDLGEWIDTPTTHIVKVIPMARDGRDPENPAAALTLDVRKDRSNVIYPASGQVESVAKQQLLPGSAQNIENDVTS